METQYAINRKRARLRRDLIGEEPMSTNSNSLNPAHPADAAMLREMGAGPQRPVIPVNGQDVSELAQMSPIDRAVRRFAPGSVEVPANSPLWSMSQDELRDAMNRTMRAAVDLRSAQDQTGHLEEIARSNGPLPDSRNVLGIPMIQTDGSTKLYGGEVQNAERLNSVSAHSASLAGMSQQDYDAAVRELANVMNPSDPTRTMRERFEQEQRSQDLQNIASTSPNAPDPQSNEATLNDLGNGQFALAYPTGEVFRGTMQQIQAEVIKAGIETKRWGRSLNAEVKQLRAQLAALQNGQAPGNPIPETPQPTWEQMGQLPDESAKWMAENFAKGLGYSNGNELIQDFQGLKSKVQQQDALLSQYKDEREVMRFHAAHPEFPATNQASDVLVKLVDGNNLDFTAENLELAHGLAIQKGFYRALTPEEVAVASGQLPANQGSRVPPTPPTGNAPGGNENLNPWSMAKDEIAKRVLEGGGLGRALLNLRPGQMLGEE
jgi:hypothetical protein